MRFSVTLIMSIVFFSGISLMLIDFILKRNQYIINIGVRFIYVCLLLISLRLLFPFELPITRTIRASKIFPSIYLLFVEPIPFLNNINLQSILAFIWLAGAIISVGKIIRSYFKVRMDVSNFASITSPDFDLIIAEITGKYKRKVHFNIVRADYDFPPMIFGIFKPYIIIPKVELTNGEWYHVFSHEIAHYYHGDLLLILVCEILEGIYWWNPLIKILKEQIADVLEVRADKKVTDSMDELEKTEYMECLIDLVKILVGRNERWNTAFYNGSTLTVARRIRLILNEEKSSRKRTVMSFVFAGLLMLAVIIPNLLIVEAYGVSDDVENESVSIDNANVYFIANPDNTYDWYVNNEYQSTVRNIFDETIPVYQSREEVKEYD